MSGNIIDIIFRTRQIHSVALWLVFLKIGIVLCQRNATAYNYLFGQIFTCLIRVLAIRSDICLINSSIKIVTRSSSRFFNEIHAPLQVGKLCNTAIIRGRCSCKNAIRSSMVSFIYSARKSCVALCSGIPPISIYFMNSIFTAKDIQMHICRIVSISVFAICIYIRRAADTASLCFKALEISWRRACH